MVSSILFYTWTIFFAKALGAPVSVPGRDYANNSAPPAATNTVAKHPLSAMFNPKLFQGDIAGYDQKSFNKLVSDLNSWHSIRQKSGNKFQSAISDPRSLWHNGRVPYVITSTDPKVRDAVEAAIKDFDKLTCIRLVPRANEEDYLNIIDTEDGCHVRNLGNGHGEQKLNLGENCKIKGIAIHEIMHALGFWHEQQRVDRDDYVIVIKENIIDGEYGQYEKANTSQMLLIGNYDMDSVMHYPSWGFAKDGKKTMRAKNSNRVDFGNYKGMTEEDKHKIQQLYRCSDDIGSTSIITGVPYYVKPAGTKYCLDVMLSSKDSGQDDAAKGLIQQFDCQEKDSQKWIFTQVSGQIYTLKNVNSGLLMQVKHDQINKDGGYVVQGPPNAYGDSQLEQIKMEPRNGNFHMTSNKNGRNLWAGSSWAIYHWERDGGQDWTLVEAGSTSIITGVPYYVKPAGTKYCLDVMLASKASGQDDAAKGLIQQFDCQEKDSQKWIFTQVSGQIYTLKNVNSGLLMQVKHDQINKDGGYVVQGPPNAYGDSQLEQIKMEPRNGNFHMTSNKNGRNLWAGSSWAIYHWEHDGGQDWTLVKAQ